ncbi:MAG: hypothetical protein QXN62_02005 [Candidatus Bathyarchaeia archaeon]|nr:hypothetical protein [Candidatus Bathyarchaeota archaeon]
MDFMYAVSKGSFMMPRETFILSITVITLTGVLGYILYKWGTDSLGQITFKRLVEVNFNGNSVLYFAIFILGLGMVAYSGYMLRKYSFAMQYLYTPAILAGLVMLFISRFLIGIPLSVTGVGRLTALLTALLVVGTALVSHIIFKESFSIRVGLGIALGVLAVILIGEA